ncbi:MAG: hypothetical protein GF334_11750 [Candidatus Altiarchaeales archaeon]|nr:hypothetical protein [Candidatus Altiarchaeales archaeon]
MNSQDDILAAKPGGAVDKALAAAGGGGGVANINIYGGDEQKVYEVVKRVLTELRMV